MKFKRIEKTRLFDDDFENNYYPQDSNIGSDMNVNSQQNDYQQPRQHHQQDFYDQPHYAPAYNQQYLDPMFLALMSIINNKSPYYQQPPFYPGQNGIQYDNGEIWRLSNEIANINTRVNELGNAVNNIYNYPNAYAYPNDIPEQQVQQPIYEQYPQQQYNNYYYQQPYNQQYDQQYQEPYDQSYDQQYQEPYDYQEEYVEPSDGREGYYMNEDNYKQFMSVLKNDVKNAREN